MNSTVNILYSAGLHFEMVVLFSEEKLPVYCILGLESLLWIYIFPGVFC